LTAPTRFLQDIIRQRTELPRIICYLAGPGQESLQHASSLIRPAPDIFLTGIGASWNAALGSGTLFSLGGRSLYMQEAGELLHFTAIPGGAVIIAISRSGRSTEIVQLLAKAKSCGAIVIGITNCADSPLARESTLAIVVPIILDHAISVNAYSSLLIAGGALASSATTGFTSIVNPLRNTVEKAGQFLDLWKAQVEESSWLATDAVYYFLARGSSIPTCQQAQLLWEEGAKMPATAMSTSRFRHGPQEIAREGMRFCLWIDQAQMRDEDLAVAHDLRELGASVMLIGENLPENAGDLVCQLPSSPPHWQFAIDMFPIQLAAERLARLCGVDCDSFRICSYIVEDEHGLRRKKTEAISNAE
jgi:glutamine---fructose-6-phosphate transaminase (isomerizing)